MFWWTDKRVLKSLSMHRNSAFKSEKQCCYE